MKPRQSGCSKNPPAAIEQRDPATEKSLFHDWAARMRTPKLRTIAEFAEDEIICPDGPFAGRRLRLDRSPAARLLYAELETGRWARTFLTGPNQDGKSLFGFIIVVMYFLFELKETVILGIPSIDLVGDKWTMALLPAIRASRYADLLPKGGKGSKDGQAMLYSFGNGTKLRFMTGGGNDQSRAGFTTRNLVVTESDGFDVVGGNSKEGSKFAQLEKRTLAFKDFGARLVSECTVSTEKGLTWREYESGTRSRIALKCPHCGAWVTPEREHLVGWQDAKDELAAIAAAAVACPECGATWTNEQRIAANHAAVLVHRGQTVEPDGTVVGPLPQTNTFGFRWTVVNCIMQPNRLSGVGGDEWKALRAPDEETAEKDLCQKEWALPIKPDKIDLTGFDAFTIIKRTLPLHRGVCPEGTLHVTVGCDMNLRLAHWTALAWRANATPHVIDYRRFEIPSDSMAREKAFLLALRDFRDEILRSGWKCGDRIITPTYTLIDAGYCQDTIIAFAAESGAGYFAAKGFGQHIKTEANAKRQTGTKIIAAGDHFVGAVLPDGSQMFQIGADYWKTWLHARLNTPVFDESGEIHPGALTLFELEQNGKPAEHLSFAKHLTAEKQVEKFDPGKGTVTCWVPIRSNNHWLDSTALACVGGSAAKLKVIAPPPAAKPRTPRPRVQVSSWLRS